jgi:hypothetical protein
VLPFNIDIYLAIMDTLSSTARVIYWCSPHLRKENHQCIQRLGIGILELPELSLLLSAQDLGLEFRSCQSSNGIYLSQDS